MRDFTRPTYLRDRQNVGIAFCCRLYGTPIDVGISGSAAADAESGGTFGGGNTIFDFGDSEDQTGLGPIQGGSQTSNPTSTASATAGGGEAVSGTPGSGGGSSSSLIWILLVAAVAAFFVLRKHLKL